MHRRLATAACLTLVLTLAACGGDGSAGGPGDQAPATDAATTDGHELVCGDASFEEGELATMPSLDELPEEVLAAVDDTGEPAVDTPRWTGASPRSTTRRWSGAAPRDRARRAGSTSTT